MKFGRVGKEEMPFKEKVYARTDGRMDEDRSQKLNLTLLLRLAKKLTDTKLLSQKLSSEL